MTMTIGQRLRRAMETRGLTQKEVSVRAKVEAATVSDIVNDRTNPKFRTVEKMAEAIGVMFGELFDEPRIYLSDRDVETLNRSTELHQRLLENDAAQKALRDASPPKPPKLPKSERPGPHPADELVHLANHKIAEAFVRQGARQAFRVITDAMIGAGFLEGDIIYVRPTIAETEADGEIIVCRLNGALKLKRLDLRGGERKLQNANPRYADLVVTDADSFHMLGVVVSAGK